jgi:hypothetical protein
MYTESLLRIDQSAMGPIHLQNGCPKGQVEKKLATTYINSIFTDLLFQRDRRSAVIQYSDDRMSITAAT